MQICDSEERENVLTRQLKCLAQLTLQINLPLIYIIIINQEFSMTSLTPSPSEDKNFLINQKQSENYLFMQFAQPDDHQYSWIDQYLNEEVLLSHQIYQVSSIQQPQTTHPSLSPLKSQDFETDKLMHVIPQQIKNKSVFHNFQKHLQRLIKKTIKLKKSEYTGYSWGNLPFQLWKIFLSLRSSSKKNLYLIFGIEQKENAENLQQMAQFIPDLQRMILKRGLKKIEEGQEALRTIVRNQLMALDKQQIKHYCRIVRFEQFYAYLRGFIEEISEGRISRRMTKERKQRILQN